ncbi:COPII subunit [Malassezia psittaci]|uniref:COPII subunit n=1 Tax=Malassezia psittaci TaxID=1821823 RepID=A0AAF0F5X3_9BASI|nr:COPII subunit [Malassezia psittaci]
MTTNPPRLPPGWTTQWDQNAGRQVFVEQATGRVSWNPPMMPNVRPNPAQRMAHPNAQARMSMPVHPSAHARTGTISNIRPNPGRVQRTPSMSGIGHAARNSIAAQPSNAPIRPGQRVVSGGSNAPRPISQPIVRPIGAPNSSAIRPTPPNASISSRAPPPAASAGKAAALNAAASAPTSAASPPTSAAGSAPLSRRSSVPGLHAIANPVRPKQPGSNPVMTSPQSADAGTGLASESSAGSPPAMSSRTRQAVAARRRAYPSAHIMANSVSFASTQPTPGADDGSELFTPAMLGHTPMRSVSGQIPSQVATTPTSQRVISSGAPTASQPTLAGVKPSGVQPIPSAGAPAAPTASLPPSNTDASMNNVAAQLQQMNVGAARSATGRSVNQLSNAVLSQQPVDMNDLDMPPPPIELPPGTGLVASPQNADPSWQRSTLNSIPTTASMLNKSKLPLAVVLSPMRSVRERDGDAPVPVVSDSVIARCRRCRTYINPFVTFVEGGHRWRCCMCNITNEVPQLFDWNPETNQPADRWKRPELLSPVVEFIAPREYMVRPPQPPVYVFLIDVSYAAAQAGLVSAAASTIQASLGHIPNKDARTRVAIIGFDTQLHFFKIAPGQEEASLLVVSDLDDVFLPQPDDLLVNLAECRKGLENLLMNLGTMYEHTASTGSALGAALQSAFKLISMQGGKIEIITASLPSIGPGALKQRDDPKLYGGPKESSILMPGSPFYKTFPIDCSRNQVSVDLWACGAAFTDISTLSCLPRYTGGQTFSYPQFNAQRPQDAEKFSKELQNVLASPVSFEAVLRLRATRGVRPSSFHGNFFVRSSDLLALPSVAPDQSYVIECDIEETINQPIVVFQSVVLHSTSDGERRIRVITLALPTTTSLSEVYASADPIAITAVYAAKAVEKALHSRLDDARGYLRTRLAEFLYNYRATMTNSRNASGAQPLSIAANLQTLPLLVLALLRTPGLRMSSQLSPDQRAFSHTLLSTLPMQRLIPYLLPSFYALHSMPSNAGTFDAATQKVILPPKMNLSSERLERHGLYLLDNGLDLILWLGRAAVPNLTMDVFGAPDYASLSSGKISLPRLDNPMSKRLHTLLDYLGNSRRGVFAPTLYLVKEDGDAFLRLWALSLLVEDRFEQTSGYIQFLGQIRDKVNGH